MTLEFLAYLNFGILALILLGIAGRVVLGWFEPEEETYAVGFHFEPDVDPEDEEDIADARRALADPRPRVSHAEAKRRLGF